jgi:dTDP-4-dehydrorhamnose 3,5-epimerase
VIFEATPLAGAFVVRIERHEDARGYFARLWCRNEFAAHGIDMALVQASISSNRRAGTLRGLHYAWPPSNEAKLVRCSQGRIHDVIVDLRPSSEFFLRHFVIELDATEHSALYIPHGFAHGFQTLVDDCEVVYMMTDFYRSELADGVRFDDPSFAIGWPRPVSVIAERDRRYPDFDRVAYCRRFGAPAG